NMLVETEGGKNYSGAEYAAWLADAGFVDIERLTFDAPGANGAVVARRA
ncbi:methyltransferase, partial [Micromonospora sp. DH15]|nr:methyltransferase [Micromonospora sp. DH15]